MYIQFRGHPTTACLHQRVIRRFLMETSHATHQASSVNEIPSGPVPIILCKCMVAFGIDKTIVFFYSD